MKDRTKAVGRSHAVGKHAVRYQQVPRTRTHENRAHRYRRRRRPSEQPSQNSAKSSSLKSCLVSGDDLHTLFWSRDSHGGPRLTFYTDNTMECVPDICVKPTDPRSEIANCTCSESLQVPIQSVSYARPAERRRLYDSFALATRCTN